MSRHGVDADLAGRQAARDSIIRDCKDLGMEWAKVWWMVPVLWLICAYAATTGGSWTRGFSFAASLFGIVTAVLVGITLLKLGDAWWHIRHLSKTRPAHSLVHVPEMTVRFDLDRDAFSEDPAAHRRSAELDVLSSP
jgi:hypothetical protein